MKIPKLWKSRENDFLDPQNGWKWPIKTAKMSKFLDQNFDFRGHYQPFELKIHPKVCLLRPNIIFKHLVKNSKTTSKNSKKRFFLPPKLPNHRCQLGKKCRLLGPFLLYLRSIFLACWYFFFKSFPLIAKHIWKKNICKASFRHLKNFRGKYAVHPPTLHPSIYPSGQ